nr:SMR family transporter [Hyphomonas sp.]
MEIVWATAVKQSAGFTRLAPGLIFFAAMPASFLLLAWAMRTAATGDRLHGLDRDWRGWALSWSASSGSGKRPRQCACARPQ